jgi:hypothetical protein
VAVRPTLRPATTLLACLALGLPLACGGASDVSPSTTDSGATGPGSGSFTLYSDRPIAGSTTAAVYRLEASLTAGTSCGSTSMDGCSIDPCYQSPVAFPVPDVGEVTFTGAQLAMLPLEPSADGTYTTLSVQGAVAWNTGGESVTVAWAHGPGATSQMGGSMTVASPPYVALEPSSALAQPASTVSRQQDLQLSWTSDSPPTSADQVLVDLMIGTTQISCAFSAAVGNGVVPAQVLQKVLAAGTGTYDIHSKEFASTPVRGPGGSTWTLSFNVDAHLRAGGGLATGAVIFE